MKLKASLQLPLLPPPVPEVLMRSRNEIMLRQVIMSPMGNGRRLVEAAGAVVSSPVVNIQVGEVIIRITGITKSLLMVA